MGVFDFLKPKQDVQELVVVPKATLSFSKPIVNDGKARNGMWVKTPTSQIGIILTVEDELATVVLTKGDGTNLMVLDANDQAVVSTVQYPVDQLTQCRRNELPSRVTLDDEALANLGYL